ncbi:MAG: glycosyltransferase family 2 protein [candidate division Zixibacteria bacterium]|nr:glycosyltransferase family 2 protein [candidate division Zixibacteria bacterium]
MSETPELSAIVISYNGMQFLPECLETLTRDLAALSHEIIVVDNGSIDRSPDFIKKRFPQIRLVKNGKNLGFAKAVNIGFVEARGKYIYLLNQDLRFRPGSTPVLLQKLKSDSHIGAIGPKFVNFEGELQWSVRAFPRHKHVFYAVTLLSTLFPRHKEFLSWKMGWFDHEHEREVDQPMGSALMMPRTIVKLIGFFDENFPIFFNDVDYCRRISDAGYKLLYFPQAVVEHYVGGSTGRRPYLNAWRSHSSMFRYLRKYSQPIEYPILLLSGLLLMLSLPAKMLQLFIQRRFTSSKSFF